jgi:hypothetical protein
MQAIAHTATRRTRESGEEEHSTGAGLRVAEKDNWLCA